MVYTTDFEIDKERIEKELEKTVNTLNLLTVEIGVNTEGIEEKLNEVIEKSNRAKKTHFKITRILNWLTFGLWTATGIIDLCSEGISKLSYGLVWGILLLTFLTNALLHKETEGYVLDLCKAEIPPLPVTKTYLDTVLGYFTEQQPLLDPIE